ncbi:MAG: aldehyde dehydrogenase, partial [Pseudopedobacter saltans]
METAVKKSGTLVDRPTFKPQYENYIGGEWVAPVKGAYFENTSPIDGSIISKVPRSSKEDIELALDAAYKVKKQWANTSVTERSNLLLKIAEVVEKNIEKLAAVETVDNGKPIRETLNADLPLVADHFRYFASVIRAEEGSANELDANTLSLIIHEPLGVVGQIIPWNFPLLMAAWKLAPALAAGNCVVLKPAEQTPVSILVFAELIGEVLPKGVLNIVNGFGAEVGKA